MILAAYTRIDIARIFSRKLQDCTNVSEQEFVRDIFTKIAEVLYVDDSDNIIEKSEFLALCEI